MSECSNDDGLGILVFLDKVRYGDLDILGMLFAENKDISLRRRSPWSHKRTDIIRSRID